MFVDAALRSEEVVECPRNGHTAENLSSELTCIIVIGVEMSGGRWRRSGETVTISSF
jgi:hypothetical protein